VGAVFLVLIAGLVVAIVARSGSGSSPSSATPQLQGVDGSPAGTTAVSQSEEPPTLVNTGEDWEAIVRSMVAYHDWLYIHPHPEFLQSIIRPDGPDFSQTQVGITNIRDKGWHYDPPRVPLLVDNVRLTSRVSPNIALVFVRYGPIPRYRVIDASGAVVSDQPAKPPNAALWTLMQDPGDAHWRIYKTVPT